VQYRLHKLAYADTRQRFALSAQVVVRCLAKVSDGYKLDRKRRRKFRQHSAIAYDDRILTWHRDKASVSIWSTSGRLKIPYVAGERQLQLLAWRQGESDLILHGGELYLAATCQVAEPDVQTADDFLGVDVGIAQIATDSDGKQYSGSAVQSVRHRQRRLRTRLQKKQTKSARRRLRKLSGKEARFARDVNHCISKQIVATAKGTGRGIAVEQLNGIRDRVKVRHTQRAVLHSWAFLQLKMFVLYKAALAGVRVVQVDPRNSSRECSCCGHTEKLNRLSQSVFSCRQCGYRAHADLNAATNLRARGRAAVNPPHVFSPLSADRTSYRLSAGSR
jgi:IS605 OrfB family transposase